jgi:peptidoglycan/xylan/chitin deacetylase (PgdA/CDA1 family)
MLGNHTHSHFALGLLPSDKIYNEILKTKNFIDNFGDKHEHTLSYPYGSFEACQNPVESIAKTIGYKIGFTMEEGVNTLEANTLLLKRFDCNDLIGGKNYKQ